MSVITLCICLSTAVVSNCCIMC